jgi:mono/diheme cytochrome c family protein
MHMKDRAMILAYLRNRLLLAALVTGVVGCGSDSPLPVTPDNGEGNDNGDSDDPPADIEQKDAGVKKKDAGAVARAKDSGVDASSTTVGGPKGNEGIPCDVAAVLASNCAMCHGAKAAFGAPMSLVTLADFQAEATTGAKMVDAVDTRINESDPRKAMPPSTAMKLTSAQRSTLNKWLTAGAPGSSDTCDTAVTTPDPVDTVDAGTSGLDCYKLTAHNGDGKTPYKVGTAKDKYLNFTFKAPWKGTAYGVLFNPITDNMKVIHHWLLFQDNSAKAATGAEDSSGAHPDGQLLFAWVPGAHPLDFRDSGDVGFEMPDNVSYTIEYHYNSSDADALDASGVELCLAKTKPANIAGVSWLGYDQLLQPATKWTGQCVPENKVPVKILAVQPHMHKTGTHMKAVIHRKGAGDEVLHDGPFDFNYQVQYLKDVTINPGDTITTECTYSQPMAFGESTDEEMCYLFTFAYPKGQLKDSGAWGSTAHGGSACLGQ